MSYTKTTWVDNSEPPISADNLNKIEQGIYDATEGLADKVDKVTGKGLSTNDYTDAEKTKLAGIDMTTKQDTLISGTNIKTVNSTSLLGSGNVAVQETLVSGTNIKTINGNSLLGSGNIVIQGGGGGGSTVSYNPTVTSGTELGKINIDGTDNPVYAPPVPTKTSDLTNDSGFLTSHQSIKTINNTSMVGSGNVAVQPTLVSGTNIKTINNASILGSGNIEIQASDPALAGRISALETEQTVLDARMDTFASLTEGSTTGDAELVDIRVGADGTTYPSAGDAVRGQVSALQSALLDELEIELYENGTSTTWENAKSEATKVTGHYINGSDADVETASNWNYYELNVEPGDVFVVQTFTNSWARCAVIADRDGNLVTAYPAENVTNKVQTHKITIPVNGAKLYVNESASTSITSFAVIDKQVSANQFATTPEFNYKILQCVNNGVEIEGLGKTLTTSYENIKSKGEKITGNFFSAYDAVPTLSAQWNYYWFNVREGEQVKVSGWSAGWARTIIFTDDTYNIIQTYPESNSTGLKSYEVSVPAGATKMVVNENPNNATTEVYRCYISAVEFTGTATNKIAHSLGGTRYEIGTDEYIYTVNFSDPDSKTFTFETLKKNGATFKDVSDDVTPLNVEGIRYIGAGHGYFFPYNLTIANHGLTEGDIGKTYNDGTNTWVLTKIVNANVIQVICYDISVWYRMKTAQTPSTVNFGNGAQTVTSSAQTHLFPSIKNNSVSLIENSDFCKVMEVYDIIDVGVGIDALVSNVGSNTNDSIIERSSSAITVRNIYEFMDNGAVTVYQNLKMINSDASLDFYGGVQSGPFGSSDYVAVAETNIEYRDANATVYFERDTWDDQTKPPVLYMQTDGQAGSKAFFTGYITENRNADIYADGSAGFSYENTRKLYPFFINPHSTQASGKTYNCVSFRIPCTLHSVANDVAYVAYSKLYDGYIVIIGTDQAVNTSVPVPDFMRNKKCETYMSDGVTVQTKTLIDRIDVQSSRRGYAILIVSVS